MEQLYQQIAQIGRRLGAQRVVLFGSRARGDARPRSDVDLAVFGLPPDRYSAFDDAIDRLPTLLAMDVVFVDASISPELRQNIEREGVDLMSKFREKYSKFCLAVDRLAEAVSACDRGLPALSQDILRDAVIQRFEFSAELAWKTLRDYLLEEGVSVPGTPKGVVREAFAAGVVDNEALWCDLLTDRNRTSHTYNEQTARDIFARICTDYLYVLQALAEKLKNAE